MEFEGLNNQIEKYNNLQNEIDKMEQILQGLRDKTKELEKEVYEDKYVNQISGLTEENLKLMLDVHLLSYQCDLLTFNNNNNNANTNVRNNPYAYGSSRLQNQQYIMGQSSRRPIVNNANNVQIAAGPSFLIQRNQPIEPYRNFDDDILFTRLPHTNQIAANLQPCKLIATTTNTNNQNHNQKSPPLPPRPNRHQHPSRSPPPPPPPGYHKQGSSSHSFMILNNNNQDNQQRKWKCARCTLENNDNLNKCEACEFVRLEPPLGSIIAKNQESLHKLTLDSSTTTTSPTSPPITHGHHHGKKWNKRQNH
ncbi:uncharacterized protein LOC142645741 [Dermatophagoides pteronyssinus]